FVYTEDIGARFDSDELCVVSFEYFCPSGLDSFQVFFGPPITEKQSARGPAPVPAETWLPYAVNMKTASRSWGAAVRQFRLDFGRRAGRTLRVRGLELRAPTPAELEEVRRAEEKRLAVERLKGLIAAYLDEAPAARVTRVAAGPERIRIEAEIRHGRGEFSFAEMPLWTDAESYDAFVSVTPARRAGRRLTAEVERFVKRVSKKPDVGEPDGSAAEGARDAGPLRDRLLSRWAVVEGAGRGARRVSPLAYATEIEPQWSPPRIEPRSKKGLGGISFRGAMMSDLVDLGIHNITVNRVLNALLSPGPSADTIPHEVGGRTYHFRRAPVERHDRVLRFAHEKGIAVSAIVLISPEKTGERRRILTHPDYHSAGIYTMPNVTTEEGLEHYAAALDFLARRYTRPDARYGRIANWIIHNEVDAGWVWTNAGEKDVLTYMDLYHRSMRVAHLVARKYDPHARVFISLTHHWAEAGNERFYAPKEMLELLAKWSRLEGDFEWGVAYHPYPQNLRDPRTWDDKRVSQSFDVTFKNIEVLDAWMRRPENRFRGERTRGVLLSEQGLNSPDYSEESLRLQAAGLVYAWRKIAPLASVEAFHYHRWVDHEREGGLLLGLWTVREGTVIQAGRKKPAWGVYRALGTPGERAASRFAEALIGESLEEIPYRGRVREHVERP
ncbi:MAG: DUF5722 domain-containing protein, partial [Planctomycetota bacterium]